MGSEEKRQHPRKDVFTAVLIVVGGEGWLSEVWDLSMGGAKLGLPKGFPKPVTGPVRLYFMIDQDTVIAMEANLVRAASDHLGMKFLEGQKDRAEKLLYETQYLESDSR